MTFVLSDHPYVNWSGDEWLLPVEQYPTPLAAYRWLHRESHGDRFRLERGEVRLHNCKGDFGCEKATEQDPNGEHCKQSAMVDCWKAVPA